MTSWSSLMRHGTVDFLVLRKNQNAISNRGWNPLNYMLLDDPDIRSTMTDNESTMTSSVCTPVTPSPVITMASPVPNLNFQSGESLNFLSSLVKHSDLQKDRENIKSDRMRGKTYTERISEDKKLTGRVIAKNGSNRLGKISLDLLLERNLEKDEQEELKAVKRYNDFIKRKQHASDILTHKTTGFNITDLKVLI